MNLITTNSQGDAVIIDMTTKLRTRPFILPKEAIDFLATHVVYVENDMVTCMTPNGGTVEIAHYAAQKFGILQ